MKKYCKKCGSLKIDVECNYYNEETGEKVHDLVCPNEKCECNCDFFGHKWVRVSWWNLDIKCGKCGYYPRNDY